MTRWKSGRLVGRELDRHTALPPAALSSGLLFIDFHSSSIIPVFSTAWKRKVSIHLSIYLFFNLLIILCVCI